MGHGLSTRISGTRTAGIQAQSNRDIAGWVPLPIFRLLQRRPCKSIHKHGPIWHHLWSNAHSQIGERHVGTGLPVRVKSASKIDHGVGRHPQPRRRVAASLVRSRGSWSRVFCFCLAGVMFPAGWASLNLHAQSTPSSAQESTSPSPGETPTDDPSPASVETRKEPEKHEKKP